MAALTNYMENKVLDAWLRAQAFTFPSSSHVGLFTVAPNEAGGGTEVTAGGYQRAQVTNSLANWAGTQGSGTTAASTGTGGTTSNNVAVTFPVATADWGTVVAFGVFDSATLGNLLFYAALTTPRSITNGSTASFAPGSLTFQIDD